MSDFYILEGHVPVRCDDARAWAWCFGGGDWRVAETTIGDVRVSTVFLGLDHSFGGGEPRLFETMVFGGEHDGYQERCSTWDEAEAMHGAAVVFVSGLLSVTNEGTASMAGEIKPLGYWRSMDEVARNMVEKARARWWLFESEVDAGVIARAPFPAGALCDRPWDISALVEE